jgi:protein-S-isoprenylcysteine O-methyltransferase Ste14
MSTVTQENKINIWGYNTIAKQILSPIILGVVLFALAGTTDWLWGWVFNVLHVLVWVGMTVALIVGNPELLNARGKRAKGTKGWDMVVLSIYGLAWISMVVVGALDMRYGWTQTPFPLLLALIGCALMVAGFALTTWGMVVNRNFELTVRLQEDRGHNVATTGPYRYVRHPGYTGVIISFFIGMPLVLNSVPALIPAVIGAAVMILRTALEDRTLQAELPGYREYTETTQYRLLPKVW